MNQALYPKLKKSYYNLSYPKAMRVARDVAGGINAQYFYYITKYEQVRQKRLAREAAFMEQLKLPEPQSHKPTAK